MNVFTRLCLPVVCLMTFCLVTNRQASADLILNFSGNVGSNVVNWDATGSITITQAVLVGFSSTSGAAPVGGAWSTGFDNNIGDLIQNGAISETNRSTPGFSYRVNGVEFAELFQIDLTASSTAGGDDIEPDVSGTVNYPSLAIGDVVSWAGSGSFTLDNSTYDTFFIGGSTGTATLDGGNYIVNVAEAVAVPEPGSLVTLSVLIPIGLLCRRRLKQASN